jgi:hypothetical protein
MGLLVRSYVTSPIKMGYRVEGRHLSPVVKDFGKVLLKEMALGHLDVT